MSINRNNNNETSNDNKKDEAGNSIELTSGPRIKSEATADFEKLVHYFLQDKSYNCYYNQLGELLIETDDSIINLSQILKHQPDFEQLVIDEALFEKYSNFLKTQAQYTPELEKKEQASEKIFPSADDYDKKDKDHKHANLHYGEKLAITLYSSNLYYTINGFLREFAKVNDNTKNLTTNQLNLKVKELVLVTGIASHGLAKVPTAKSENNEVVRHERSRNMKKVLEEREKNINNTEAKPTFHEGFTSTTGYSKAEDEKKFHLGGGLTSPDVKITINQNINEDGAYNPLGKDITALSPYNEKETLFIPNTQFVYTGMTQGKYGNISFTATPVRSIDQINPLSYTSKLDFIRTMLISIKEDNEKNKFSISKNINNVFKSFSSNSINKRLQNQMLETLIKKTDGQQGYNADELNQLKTFFKQELNNRKYNFKLKKSDKKSNMLRKAISTIDNLLTNKIKQESNNALLNHANYIYNILSKSYKDAQLGSKFSVDASLKVKINDKFHLIHRPNHGLAHSLRVANYIPSVINYFKQFAKDKNFKSFCENISVNEFRSLQLAMLFSVSGRESDIGFMDDQVKYREYRKKCAEQYKAYASQIGIPEKEINKYAELVEHMGNPEYFKNIPKDQPEKSYLFILMNLSHKLDLMRCYDKIKYTKAISGGNDPYITPSTEQANVLNQLYQLVHNSIEGCGDRMLTAFKNGELSIKNTNYNEKVFFTNSTIPELCLQTCAQAAEKTFNGTYELSFKTTDSLTTNNQEQPINMLNNNNSINTNNDTVTQRLTPAEVKNTYEPIARDIFVNIVSDLGFKHFESRSPLLEGIEIIEDKLKLQVSILTNNGKDDRLSIGIDIAATSFQQAILNHIAKHPTDYMNMALTYLQNQKRDEINIPAFQELDHNYQIQDIKPISGDPNHFTLIAKATDTSRPPVEIIMPAEKIIGFINDLKELNNQPTLHM